MEDVSVLREQYRQSRDSQRSHTHVLLYGTVSERLSDAVTIVPVTQGFTSSPPTENITCSLGPSTYDPWHVHLDLHRRFSCSLMVAPHRVHSPKLGTSRRSSSSSSSSSESSIKSHKVPSTPESQRIHIQTSTFSSQHQFSDSDAPEQNPDEGSGQSTAPASDVPPVESHSSAHCTSTSSLQTDLKRKQPSGVKSSICCSTRKDSSTREQSPGSTCLHHNQDLNHFPFPSRKTPRISEAAKRLGLYSSF